MCIKNFQQWSSHLPDYQQSLLSFIRKKYKTIKEGILTKYIDSIEGTFLSWFIERRNHY